jgi:polyisoprenoid-binding protein YceI
MTTTVTAATTPATARTYTFDKAHSEVTFQVRHLITKVRGRFSDFEGTIVIDDDHPERSSVAMTIKAASIDTSEPDRDKHLRSADFFSVDEHPALTFASTRITKKGTTEYDVAGTLTIRGVAKEITLPVTFLGVAKDPWGNERVGFETEITINRKDFALAWNAALETGGFLVGDDVKISGSIQAIAK